MLCFIEPIVGNRGPGDSEPGDTWISLNHHLNYVAGSTGPPLPHLRTDPATNAVDNQGQALAAPCLGKSRARSGSLARVSNDSKVSLDVTPKSKRQSATRHQNVYHKQTTVSPSPPASYNHCGAKKPNVYETSLASLPRARTISLGRARSAKVP